MEKDTKKYRKNPFVKESALEMTEDDSVFFNLVLKPTLLSDFAKSIVLKRDVRKILDESMKMKTNPIGSFLSKSLGRFVIPNYNVPLNNQSFEYVLGSLEYLKDNDYFIDEEKLTSHISVSKEKTPDKKIDYIGVVTGNRPEQLRKFLEECEKIQSPEHPLNIIVSDDSLDPKAIEENLEVIKEKKGVFGGLYYINNKKREDASKILSEKSGISPEDVSYGITKSNTPTLAVGPARNYILLATAGKNVVMLDDDVVFSDVRVFNDLQNNDITYNAYLHLKQTNHKDLESVGGKKSEKTIIQLLQSVVGKNINELIDGRKIKFDEVSDRLLISAKNSTGHIKMATLGHFGHSAMWSQDAFLRLEYDRKDHISHKTAEEYKELKEYPIVTNIADSDVIFDASSFVALNFVLDNTTLSPFFEPVGRSEDTIFITLFKNYHDEAYKYVFKEAVRHIRPGVPNVLYDIKSRLSPDNVLAVLIKESFEKIKEESDSIDKMYENAGDYIKEIAELDSEKFEEKIDSIFNALINTFYYDTGFTLYLNKKGNSEWRKDMENDMETLIEMKKNKMDIRYYGQKESVPIVEIQKMLHSFGKFQKAWPTLWNVSKDLDIDFFAEKI